MSKINQRDQLYGKMSEHASKFKNSAKPINPAQNHTNAWDCLEIILIPTMENSTSKKSYIKPSPYSVPSWFSPVSLPINLFVKFVVWWDFLVFFGSQLSGYLSLHSYNAFTQETFPTQNCKIVLEKLLSLEL